jgi:hypothetical protein
MPVLDQVLEQIDSATVDAVLAERVPLPGGRIAIRNAPPRLMMIGYANELSPGLLAWHAPTVVSGARAARLPRRGAGGGGSRGLARHARGSSHRGAGGFGQRGVPAGSRGRARARRRGSKRASRDGASARTRVGRFRITRFEKDRR